MDIYLTSVQRLQEGLEFFDQYEPVPSDDTQIYAMPENESLHEFVADDGVLRVGDLRNILALLKENGIVLDANS